jgi:hypothetical protein
MVLATSCFSCDKRYTDTCYSVINFCQRLQQSVQDYLKLGIFSKNIPNSILLAVFIRPFIQSKLCHQMFCHMCVEKE